MYDERGARGAELAREARASAADPEWRRGAEPVRLAGTLMLSWDDYLRYEERLCLLIEDEQWPLDDAMLAGLALMNAMHDSSGSQASSKNNMELVLDAIASRRPMIGLHRYVTAGLVASMECATPARGGIGERARRVGLFLKLLLRRGAMTFAGIENTVSLAAIPRVRWPKRDHPRLTPLRRFLSSHIRHKALLQWPDVEYGYHLLIAAYATVKFYARAAAVARDRDSVHADDLRFGVRAVELNLLLHRRGGTIHEDVKRPMLRKFLFHPAYPSSMTAF